MSSAPRDTDAPTLTLSQSQAQSGLSAGAPNATLPSHSPSSSAAMSRSPTVTSDSTAADHTDKWKSTDSTSAKDLPAESTLGQVEKQLELEGKVPPSEHGQVNALASLPAGRKSILLFCFCLSMVRRASHMRIRSVHR